ncbi:MAG: GolD/DthD family dehydrogenase [Gluconobacter potus]|uniref:D-threitol dehydrogenase n=1 Tax=Gluconobacter potus TaxID=2724927 RepID=A0A149QVM4_9PROT|nr:MULTISPECIES: D-threitol dehydrogenase [Gluconobacter]KXV01369.1 short-chain dehydrogenase [Gluconobacter potus]MBF0851440.1 D-threitol dehydrogenase [Gluconobacter sp. R75690]MBF0865537.1 D-threitol dehydrogenase [Gluconobacter sp. R71656]MBF0868510.1 D-threitol dehydrogenase [Gluconobacter sp. R75628]MBF0874523.1 D-threitol dehydrogenase [Gluconobacter sp. R75629]
MKSFSALFSLENRSALVTGGASGIGFAIAQRLAEQGARVCLVDRSPTVRDAAARLGDGHIGIEADVTDETAVTRACQAAIEHAGKIDILVNNAGIALIAPAAELTTQAWDTTLSINLRAPFLFARALGPHMCSNGFGRIVNLASQAALVALEGHIAYTASKAGILGLTKVLAFEWGPHGVTTNAVSPTVVETELGKQVWAGPVGDAFRAQVPTGRFAQPDEIACAVTYLVSEAAAMVNGENLVVDGGYTIR